MFLGTLLLFITVFVVILILGHPCEDHTNTKETNDTFRIVSRFEWVAQPPTNPTTPLMTPVKYVITHHTATENCSSLPQCILQIQTFHIESLKFYDIGYNFLVGGDGAAYEARGWTIEGAHTLGRNRNSLGVAFIGTFTRNVPPEIQLVACKRLISRAVEQGYLKKNYGVMGKSQLQNTQSPGADLLQIIKKWPEWILVPEDG